MARILHQADPAGTGPQKRPDWGGSGMTMQSGSFAAIQEAEEEGHRALRAAYDCFIAEDPCNIPDNE